MNGFIILVSLLVTLNIFHTFFQCFYCWLGTDKCLLGSILSCCNFFEAYKNFDKAETWLKNSLRIAMHPKKYLMKSLWGNALFRTLFKIYNRIGICNEKFIWLKLMTISNGNTVSLKELKRNTFFFKFMFFFKIQRPLMT